MSFMIAASADAPAFSARELPGFRRPAGGNLLRSVNSLRELGLACRLIKQKPAPGPRNQR
jgi:hypothetical protein